jgi:hypothetical protein
VPIIRKEFDFWIGRCLTSMVSVRHSMTGGVSFKPSVLKMRLRRESVFDFKLQKLKMKKNIYLFWVF